MPTLGLAYTWPYWLRGLGYPGCSYPGYGGYGGYPSLGYSGLGYSGYGGLFRGY